MDRTKKCFAIAVIIFCFLIDANTLHTQWVRCKVPELSSIALISIKDSLIILAGLNQGVFISTDFGGNWTSTGEFFQDNFARNVLINKNHIIVNTQSGIFISTDSGKNWNKQYEINNEYSETFLVADNNLVFSGGDRLLRSIDNGMTWKDITFEEIYFEPPVSLAIDGNDIFLITRFRVFKSSNNGDSWKMIFDYSKYNDINNIFLTSEFLFISDFDYGILRSLRTNYNWYPVNNGLEDYVNYLFSIYTMKSYNNSIFIGTNMGIFLSNNFGGSWEIHNFGLVDTVITSLDFGFDYIFAAASNGQLYKAKLKDFGITSISENPNKINSIRIYPNPAKDFVILENLPENCDKIFIFDESGKQVKNVNIKNQDKTLKISIKDLSQGLYILRVYCDGDVIDKKIIIER